jgi:hypothetical protein
LREVDARELRRKIRIFQNEKLESFKTYRVGLSRDMNATRAATLLVFDGF